MTPLIATQISRDLIPRRRREVLMLAAKSVRQDAHMIGWLPWAFYEQVDASGTLISVTREGELVGFCAFGHGPAGQLTRITQTWVREDARQIEHGRALLARVARCASEAGTTWLSCWVAADLAAMRFWPAIGFQRIAARVGRGPLGEVARCRTLHQFVRQVPRVNVHQDESQHRREGARRAPVLLVSPP